MHVQPYEACGERTFHFVASPINRPRATYHLRHNKEIMRSEGLGISTDFVEIAKQNARHIRHNNKTTQQVEAVSSVVYKVR